MKKYIVLSLFISFLSIINLSAQSKVGSFDLQKVLPKLPEYKTAQASIETYVKQIEQELKSKEDEFKNKLEDYQAKAATLSPVFRESKEKELQTLEAQYQEFQQNVQSGIQREEGKLLSPIYAKIEKAIKEVAEGNGYQFVVRAEACSAPLKSQDISDLVLKKLGVQ
jgi:outer membrane protein